MFEIISCDELLKRLDKYSFKEGHIHHTWSPRKTAYDGTDASAQKLQKGMQTFHMETNHWSDIGQHATLLTDGRFITGRPFNQTPASILGYNTGAFACEMLGDFDKGEETFTGPQKTSALRLAKYFDDKGKYNRFHRENAPKTCPGSGIDKPTFMSEARGTVITAAPIPALTPHPGNELVRQLQELCNEAGLRDKAGIKLKVDGLWGTHTQDAAPILKKGCSTVYKWTIKLLQKQLIALGYKLPKFGADGDYGTETMNAVISYQKKNNLVADGTVGKITWNRILGV